MRIAGSDRPATTIQSWLSIIATELNKPLPFHVDLFGQGRRVRRPRLLGEGNAVGFRLLHRLMRGVVRLGNSLLLQDGATIQWGR